MPRNAALRSMWAQRIGCERILAKSAVRDFCTFICASHFSDMCFREDGNLRRDCLPTKGLPGMFKNDHVICAPFNPQMFRRF